MKRNALVLTVLSLALGVDAASPAKESGLQVPKIGEPAPAFSLPDTGGKLRSLAGEKGKFVVLEWTDHRCPYVAKHYDSGNMQRLQRTYTAKGVTWFSIISLDKGLKGKRADKDVARLKAAPTAVLLDKDGKTARLYGAACTPDMYIVDPKGVLIYEGAIDSVRSSDAGDIEFAENFVSEALDEALAGKPVTRAATKPYGCPLKYK